MDGSDANEDFQSAQLLRETFHAFAHVAVSDIATVPTMTAPLGDATAASRRRRYWAAPVAAAAAVAAIVVATMALTGNGKSISGVGSVAGGQRTTGGAAHTSAATQPPATRSSRAAPAIPVKVSSALNDGQIVGVGEPIVLSFSPAPTDSSAFTKAVTVTVDGTPAAGAWYWEKPYAGQPIQAHYREAGYWPANATIKVTLPIGGLSAGNGLAYSGALSSITFHTGDAHVSLVDAATLQMTVTDNGKLIRTIPVSLGAAKTPTYNGTKIVMQKGEDVPGSNTLRSKGTVMMSGPGYTNDPVPWSVRITASGEYVHAAGWNSHIGTQSTSNGCTNLKPADGQWFYEFSQLGDVVKYLNTDGTRMNPMDGLGDWNIAWGQWKQGGLLINH